MIGYFGSVSDALATVYYINADCGTSGDGTTATCNGDADDSFDDLDDFTEVARSVGDIAFVRRGTASTTDNASDLGFVSDGSASSPIIVSADYDNIWGDFATSTQTYSIAAATTSFYASAPVSDIAAGDWIYVEGDCFENPNTTSLNACEFAYEVLSVAGNELNLRLPYKGNQSGSGISLRIMPANPIWGLISQTTLEWQPGGDNNWYFKGLQITGDNSNGSIVPQASTASDNWYFDDFIYQGLDTGSRFIGFGGSGRSFSIGLHKFNNKNGRFSTGNSMNPLFVSITDSYINNNNQLTAAGSVVGAFYVKDTIIVSDSSVVEFQFSDQIYARFRNVITTGGGALDVNLDAAAVNKIPSIATDIFFEDSLGIVGDNRFAQSNIDVATAIEANPTLRSTTTVLRSGGGPSSIHVIPDSNISSVWAPSHLKLFEYPIYADTSSKQYDIYFKTATSTTEWTADPVALELWIECEYWAHDTGATSTRKIKKSTGVIDFNGSNDWQALSVTCQPTQDGILYLRGWYAKTKETGTNQFIIDGTPVIQ